jgi:hypothetical protein
VIPNQIRVFDGLRITTEHVEHLQAGFATAVQDLRTIAGLNRVHRGFEVVASGDDSIEVRPGLAFDSAGNRIVSDQPQVLAVEWAPEEAQMYVCISYEQVLTGEIEQHPTLVFDSGAISIEGEPPAEGSGGIILARLVRTPENESGFRIEPAPRPPDVPTPEEPVAAAEAPSVLPLRVVLGLAHLAPSPDAPSLIQLLSSLRDEAVVTLAEVPLRLDFEPLGLSCDTHLAIELTFLNEAEGSEAAAVQVRSAVANARGEASFSERGEVAQQSVSDIQTYAGDELAGRRAISVSDAALAVIQVEAPGPAGVEVQITIFREESGSPAVRCSLAGKGATTQDLIEILTTAEASLSWQATVAWRALRP